MKFFAVTTTLMSASVYSVEDRREDGCPVVKKIALKGESAVSIGEKLKGGSLVGITPMGIVLYDEDHPGAVGELRQKPEQVNIAFWGGVTSALVALFLDEGAAMACFNSSDLKPSDARWQTETKEVLTSITGENNTVFIVSHYSSDVSKFHFPD